MDMIKSLKEKGLRATRARAGVLAALCESDGPMMAEELHERCGLPLSTVYRVLSDLEEYALAERMYDEIHGCARYTVQGRAPCCVMHCLGCDQTVSVHMEEAERAAEETVRRMGFETLSHRIELSGYCARCRERQKADESKNGKKIAAEKAAH